MKKVFIASVKAWNGSNDNPAKADKKGKMPLVLVPISGTAPRGLNIISGTSAELQGFKAGSVHVVSFTEGEPVETEENGTVRSFNFSSVGTVNAIDIMSLEDTSLTVLIQAEQPAVAQPAVNAEA